MAMATGPEGSTRDCGIAGGQHGATGNRHHRLVRVREGKLEIGPYQRDVSPGSGGFSGSG